MKEEKMRFLSLFAFVFFSLSSAQALSADRLNNSRVVHNGTIDDLRIQLNRTNEQLNITKFELEEAYKQRKVDKANAERCGKQLAAQNLYNSLIKPYFFRRPIEHFGANADVSWELEGVTSFFNGSTDEELYSEEFDLREYPFKAQAKLSWNNENQVRFGLSFKDLDEKEGPIDVTVFPRIVCIVRDQSSKVEPKDWFTSFNPTFNSKQRKYDTFYHYLLRRDATDVINTTAYTLNDTLVMDIHVEAPEVAELAYSYDGTVTWAVDNYKKMKHMAIEGLVSCVMSPYFYTAYRGYRVSACVRLNGYGNYTGQGLSITLRVLKGRFDEQLEEFGSHQTNVTVFHPIENERKIIKQMTTDEIKHTIDVGSHEEIEKLVHEDTLYYTVSVEQLI